VRPKGATPALVSLVPAFLKCGSPTNRQHGGGLPFDACNPPEVESSYLTVGTPDANGQIAGSNGSLRLDVCPVPGCAAGDVKFHSSISDVRNKDLSSYGGELEGRLVLRITDSLNGPGSNEPATVVDTPFSFPMSCVGVLAPTGGSVCSADTTANAVVPGSVPQGARSIWELGQAEVYDGGADGAASTRSDNTAFMRQGLFIP
jgi:hypothetical protein